MTDLTNEFRAINDEFNRYRQAAGLKPADKVFSRLYDSPDDLRRAHVKLLQAALPASYPKSITAALSAQATGPMLAKTEDMVKTAVLKAAHEGPTLREVVVKDQSGRESIEFYGPKKQWMSQYSAPALLMKRCGNATY